MSVYIVQYGQYSTVAIAASCEGCGGALSAPYYVDRGGVVGVVVVAGEGETEGRRGGSG